jgi:hypothetical protein
MLDAHRVESSLEPPGHRPEDAVPTAIACDDGTHVGQSLLGVRRHRCVERSDDRDVVGRRGIQQGKAAADTETRNTDALAVDLRPVGQPAPDRIELAVGSARSNPVETPGEANDAQRLRTAMKSGASDTYPASANRLAIDRMSSLSPKSSWITITAGTRPSRSGSASAAGRSRPPIGIRTAVMDAIDHLGQR